MIFEQIIDYIDNFEWFKGSIFIIVLNKTFLLP